MHILQFELSYGKIVEYFSIVIETNLIQEMFSLHNKYILL